MVLASKKKPTKKIEVRKKKKVKYDGFAGAKDEATGNTGSFVTEDNEFIDEVLNYLLNIMES